MYSKIITLNGRPINCQLKERLKLIMRNLGFLACKLIFQSFFCLKIFATDGDFKDGLFLVVK